MIHRVLLVLLFVVGLPFLASAETLPAVSVTDAWSRPATGTGVIYATLHNNAAMADDLIGASSPLARHIGLHETSEMKMPGMSTSMGNMPMTGSMTSMKSVSSIPVPAHGTTSLAPGGYHLMLDLRRDLKAGETVPLRLHFARVGWVTTSAQVRPIR
jgi:copper(I)-binding protein